MKLCLKFPKRTVSLSHCNSTCKLRPAWHWTQTGLASSRWLDRDEKLSHQSEFVPVSCKWPQISDRVHKFQACILLGQLYIYCTRDIILFRIRAPIISSRFHVNGCKNFIPVQVHTGLISSRSHVNTPLVEIRIVLEHNMPGKSYS